MRPGSGDRDGDGDGDGSSGDGICVPFMCRPENWSGVILIARGVSFSANLTMEVRGQR